MAKKYRVVEYSTPSKIWYELEERILWFLWLPITQVTSCVDGLSGSETIYFESIKEALIYIKNLHPIRKIVYEQ